MAANTVEVISGEHDLNNNDDQAKRHKVKTITIAPTYQVIKKYLLGLMILNYLSFDTGN